MSLMVRVFLSVTFLVLIPEFLEFSKIEAQVLKSLWDQSVVACVF